MQSKWFESKVEAINLRKKGKSIRAIEIKLGIPRSTLSNWFRGIKISKKHESRLKNQWKRTLKKARIQAVVWHNQQKAQRLIQAEREAQKSLNLLSLKNISVMELALAMLYLGEGSKKTDTSMGNSNPMILKFFITVMRQVYGMQSENIKCELHIRADQKPGEIRKYWSKELGIPEANFYAATIDKRTTGKPTYPTYKGVCLVRCGNIAIQRKLMYLSNAFCEQVIKGAISSVG